MFTNLAKFQGHHLVCSFDDPDGETGAGPPYDNLCGKAPKGSPGSPGSLGLQDGTDPKHLRKRDL